MHKISVAVLRGGPSSEYDVSLLTGASILKNVPEKYKTHDILIDKEGVWHREGMPKTPHQALQGIDVVVNAMHGEYGEDGKVQQILEHLNMPYTGSGVLSSALAMNKSLSKKVYEQAGLKTPVSTVVKNNIVTEDIAKELFRSFPLPVIIKPNSAGSSVGITIARDYHSVLAGLEEAFKYGDQVLVEQFVQGREATCGVIEQFRNEEVYSLLPVEIIPPQKSGFFSKEVKYNGETREICPGNFNQEITEQLQEMAIKAHTALGMRHYSRSDFIVAPKGVYILETNSLPGLTEHSLLPKSLIAVGSNLTHFLDHLIMLARGRKS